MMSLTEDEMWKGFDDLRKENRYEIIFSETENISLLGKNGRVIWDC